MPIQLGELEAEGHCGQTAPEVEPENLEAPEINAESEGISASDGKETGKLAT